jgi:putative FmdB family regulatory protein|tara:strand:- start:766 stop:1146 length:381 start_codon:yes stop_codon:yes gene_type:complete
MILYDFQCHHCNKTFEHLSSRNTISTKCPCGGMAKKTLSFNGYIKIGEGYIDKGLKREVSPGKSLLRPWKEERDYTKVRDIERKNNKGETVRRISMDVSDGITGRGLNTNLRQDIKRAARERKKHG